MSMSGGSSGGITSEINVTPMADIMLVLLIIFMITAPLLTEGIVVNKAKATNPTEAVEVEAKNVIEVTLTRNSEIYINSVPIRPEDVAGQLMELGELAGDLPLFLKSDVAAPYGLVVDIVNKARDAGVEKIGLIVDEQDTTFF
jgi:biopolymer transport protein TolR